MKPSGVDGLVSVIIPTYESAGVLEGCLRSIRRQRYPAIEVIVVDGFSRDGTREIASKFGARIILAQGTQARARNLGLANSRGSYILFLDSDQRLEPGVVEECVNICRELGVEAVKIPELFKGLGFWGRSSALWKNRMVEAWGPSGGIPRFFRREILVGSGIFREELRFWEDIDLYERLKHSGLREAWCGGHIIHLEDPSPRRVVQKYVAYGRSMKAQDGSPSISRYASTARLTASTIMRLLRRPGRQLATLLGCLIIVTIKTLSIVIGIIAKTIL